MTKYYAGMISSAVALGFAFSFISQKKPEVMTKQENTYTSSIKLFLCGDVMTGRGIDQALPSSVDPVLYESYVKDARIYLKLAENENGDIDEPVSYDYIWGDAMEVWKENNPYLKIINLETSITTNEIPWPGKGINYRMHPENIEVLTIAGIDHCSLANNHTLDWSRGGLTETMQTLKAANIAFSGIGKNKYEAAKASILNTGKGRVLIFSYGSPNSGIPRSWAAEVTLSGVNYLPDLSEAEINEIKNNVKSVKNYGDVVVFSVHWGGNWGYKVNDRQIEFAHKLIDEGGVDIIFGHSSHHPMGIEVYNEKLIIYGAGDFINDYEGISGHEEYRNELTFMYFPEVNVATEKLTSLKLVPMEMKKFQLNYAVPKDALWLQSILNREGKKLGTSVRRDNDNNLWLEW